MKYARTRPDGAVARPSPCVAAPVQAESPNAKTNIEQAIEVRLGAM
jgi:hypothetical protein